MYCVHVYSLFIMCFHTLFYITWSPQLYSAEDISLPGDLIFMHLIRAQLLQLLCLHLDSAYHNFPIHVPVLVIVFSFIICRLVYTAPVEVLCSSLS